MSSLDAVLAAGLALLALAHFDTLYSAAVVLIFYALLMATANTLGSDGGGGR